MNHFKPAPPFRMQDENGKWQYLESYSGQWVLLYFYPKDMTPGCTVEAQCFRDHLNDFKKLNVQVLGVSMDSMESHREFIKAHHLNFPLLSDPDHKTIEAYGVWAEKTMFGNKFMGIQRDSFLISPHGELVKHYVKVKPETHPEEVLADMKSLV